MDFGAIPIPPDAAWNIGLSIVATAIIALLVFLRDTVWLLLKSVFCVLTKRDPIAPYLGEHFLVRTERGKVMRPKIRIYRNLVLLPKAEFYLPAALGGSVCARGRIETYGEQIWIQLLSTRRSRSRMEQFWMCLKMGETTSGSDIRLALILSTKFELAVPYTATFILTRKRELTDEEAIHLLTRNSTNTADNRLGAAIMKKAAKIDGFDSPRG